MISTSGKRLLVTGGSGFIGAEVVSLARQGGLDVKNLDIVQPRVAEHVPLWSRVDVRSAEEVRRQILQYSPNYVVHLASDVDISYRTIDEYRTIIAGTENVLRAVKEVSDLIRFVHVSTQFVVTPGVKPSSETHFEPYTLYGEAKAISEKRVRSAGLRSFVIVRPTIIWGPWHPSFPDLIWKYIATRKYLHPASREPIMRTYGFVRNTAEQMVQLATMTDESSTKTVFYLGDGALNYDDWADGFAVMLTGHRCRRVPKSLLYAAGAAGSLLKTAGLPAPIDLGRCFRMTTSSEIDLSDTFAATGRPKVSFHDGLVETVDWLAARNPAVFSKVSGPPLACEVG